MRWITLQKAGDLYFPGHFAKAAGLVAGQTCYVQEVAPKVLALLTHQDGVRSGSYWTVKVQPIPRTKEAARVRVGDALKAMGFTEHKTWEHPQPVDHRPLSESEVKGRVVHTGGIVVDFRRFTDGAGLV